MDGIERERQAHRRNALKLLGVDPNLARMLSAQVSMPGMEAEILALPVWTGNQVVMQNGANPQFMFGLSAWGGSDEF